METERAYHRVTKALRRQVKIKKTFATEDTEGTERGKVRIKMLKDRDDRKEKTRKKIINYRGQ
jgi:hypothetical protein